MGKNLKIISPAYLEVYPSQSDMDWLSVSDKLNSKANLTTEDFEHYIIASALYSSKIEGNTLDANSFFRNRDSKVSPNKKEVQEIENLVKAYKFCSENTLNKANFLKAHEILTKTLLSAKASGRFFSSCHFKEKSTLSSNPL